MNEKAEDRQSFIFRFCTTMTACSAFRAEEEADTIVKTGSKVGAVAGYVDIVNTAWQSAILQKEELYE